MGTSFALLKKVAGSRNEILWGEPPPSLLKRAQVPEIRNPKFLNGGGAEI